MFDLIHALADVIANYASIITIGDFQPVTEHAPEEDSQVWNLAWALRRNFENTHNLLGAHLS